MRNAQYKDYEVGAGWIDPGSLGSRLRTGVNLLNGRRDSAAGSWLGAIALSLVILSWWNDMTVSEVVLWIASEIRQILA